MATGYISSTRSALRATFGNPAAFAALAIPSGLGALLFGAATVLLPTESAVIANGTLDVVLAPAWWMPVRAALAIVAAALIVFGVSAATVVISQRAQGRRASIVEGWRVAGRRIGAVLLTGAVVAIGAAIGIWLLVAAVEAGFPVAVPAIALVIASIALYPIVVAPAVAVLSGLGPLAAMGTAWRNVGEDTDHAPRTRWTIVAVLAAIAFAVVFVQTQGLAESSSSWVQAAALVIRGLIAVLGVFALTGVVATLTTNELQDEHVPVALAASTPRRAPAAIGVGALALAAGLLGVAVAPTAGVVAIEANLANHPVVSTRTAFVARGDSRLIPLGDRILFVEGGGGYVFDAMRFLVCERDDCFAFDVYGVMVPAFDWTSEGDLVVTGIRGSWDEDDAFIGFEWVVVRVSGDELAEAGRAAAESEDSTADEITLGSDGGIGEVSVLETVRPDEYVDTSFLSTRFSVAVDASGPEPVVGLTVRRPGVATDTAVARRCDDPTCAASTVVIDAVGELGITYSFEYAGTTSLSARPDGEVSLASVREPNLETVADLVVWTSADGGAEPQIIDLGSVDSFSIQGAAVTAATTPDGSFVFMEGGTDRDDTITLIRCLDVTCSETATREIGPQAEGGSVGLPTLAVDDTGRAMWVERADGLISLISCTTVECDRTERRVLGPQPDANGPLGLTLLDGLPAVAAGNSAEEGARALVVWCEAPRCGAE